MRSCIRLAAVIAVFIAAGCGLAPKGPDYRSQGGKIPSLEVPPDLTSPTADDRFVIPDPKASTYSAYSRDRSPSVSTGGGILPKVDGARIERNGDQRWLVVKVAPDKLWPAVKEFWMEMGFVLRREVPEAGVMETDWAENRSKIPQDMVRRTIGKVLDGLYDTGYRDKFRTRLEAGGETGTTEIYVSHRGAEEVYTTPDKTSTTWQSRPTDRDLEAEMLSRLMVKLGAAPATAAAAAGPGGTAVARSAYDKGDTLKVNEPFDRAWRRVGLALDRVGFTVEDRDRSKGIFFVRYIDPEAELKPAGEKGFLDRFAFWRKDEPAAKPQYRIVLREAAGITDVAVQGADGKVDSSPTARKILGLLFEQLR